MNLAIFWRLVWKEYRLQRALWLSMLVLTGLLLLLVDQVTSNPKDRLDALTWIALGLPAFYALGCGATLFAGEHDADTYEFQRSLPVRASQAFWGKITFATLSTAAMFGLMWSLYFLLNHSYETLSGNHAPAEMWATVGFFGLEMFLWATLVSLLSRRVLISAILGVTIASLSSYVLAMAACPQPEMTMKMYLAAFPWRVGVAAVVALADILLGYGWFRQPRDQRRQSIGSPASVGTPIAATESLDRFRSPDRMAIFWRLVWQQWRQSAPIMATIGAVIVLLVGVPQGLFFWDKPPSGDPLNWYELAGKPLCLAALMALPLLGVCAFLSDQRRNSFRFLADRGVPPKYVWLSRLFVALAPLVFVLPVVLAFAYYFAPSRYVGSHEIVYYGVQTATFVLAYVVVALSAGQLCSMFFHSGILAGLFSLIFAVLLAGWCGLMWLWGINWFWSVLPIPLALLLATWLRAPDWLRERNTLRAWLLPGLVLIVPAATLAVAVPLYRIYTVHGTGVMPFVTGLPIPSFLPMEYLRLASPEEEATFNLYERAFQELTHFPARTDEETKEKQENPRVLAADKKTWVDENQKVVAMLLDASQKKLSHRWGRQNKLPLQEHFDRLPQLLIYSATKLEEEGKLDAALERYLAVVRISAQFREPAGWYNHSYDMERDVYARLPLWATCPNQTPERITGAIRQLEQICSKLPAGGDRIRDDYGNIELFLSGDPRSIAVSEYNSEPVPPLTVLWLHLPWERERAMRILNKLTNEKLNVLDEAEYSGQHNKKIQRPLRQYEYDYDYVLREHVEWPYAMREAISVPPISYGPLQPETDILNEYVAIETRRRAVRLILALEAWKLQHGALPEALDELVGTYFDELPVDPFSGEPFLYFREGAKLPLPLPPRDYYRREKFAADTPFVWSVGKSVECNPNADNFFMRYSIITYHWPNNTVRTPASEFDVWEAGWPFPIP